MPVHKNMEPKLKWLAAILVPILASCSSTAAIVKKDKDIKPVPKQEVEVAKTAPAGNPHQQGAFHIVGTNESLQHICNVYGLDLSKVAKVNRILAPYSLKPGDTIFCLPRPFWKKSLLAAIKAIPSHAQKRRKPLISWHKPLEALETLLCLISNFPCRGEFWRHRSGIGGDDYIEAWTSRQL